MSGRLAARARRPRQLAPVQRLALALAAGVALHAGVSAAPAQEPRLRVACVGDSITHGGSNADHEENAWPAILGRLLEATHPGRYETRNFGVPGACAFRAGNRPYWNEPEFVDSQAWEPDIVVVNFGTNDARTSNWVPNAADFERDYRDLVETYRGLAGEPEVLLTNLTHLPSWFRYIDEVTPNRPIIVETITGIAQELGLGVIDLHGATVADELYVADGIHTSTAGNERVARWVHRAITRVPAPRDASLRAVAVEGTEQVFVDGGQATSLSLGNWTQGFEFIEGTGLPIYTPFTCGDDDFHVRVRLQMLDQAASDSHVVLNGNAFGLESTRNSVYREGPDFDGQRFLFPSDFLWTAGDWIDVELVRNRGRVWFLIEGRVAIAAPIDGPVTSLGLAPGSSRMRVSAWSVTTAPRDDNPASLSRRTAATPWVDLSTRADLFTEFDRRPDAWASPAWLAESPDGLEVARVDWFKHAGHPGAVKCVVRTSADAGVTWSPATKLPVSLAGVGHRAVELDDGRLAVTFWDRGAGSPTYGDLVLWIGTYAQLTDGHEGLFTVRLTRDRTMTAREPFVSIAVTAPDEVTARTLAWNPDASATSLVAVRVPVAEADALVPTGAATVPTATTPPRPLVAIGPEAGPVAVVPIEGGAALLAASTDASQGGAIVLRRSDDDGVSWSAPLTAPAALVPVERVSLHAVDVPGATTPRLILWAGGHPARIATSDDEGASWSTLSPVGAFGGRGALASLSVTATGEFVGYFHDDGAFLGPVDARTEPPTYSLHTTRSADGGATWSTPETIAVSRERWLVDPCAVPSPDGQTLALVAGDASGGGSAVVLFSFDDGVTWTPPRELPAALAGTGHAAAHDATGDLFVAFRAHEPLGDVVAEAPGVGSLIVWSGQWSDLLAGTPGRGRVVLADANGEAESSLGSVSLVGLASDSLCVAATGAFAGPGPIAGTSVTFAAADLEIALGSLPIVTPVFASARDVGPGQTHTYRAPSLAVTPSGTIVAAVDARRLRGDELPGDLDLVVRRSTDGGESFEPELELFEATGSLGVSQASLAVDPTTGSLHCTTVGSHGASLADSATGFGIDSLHNFALSSADDGLSWSAPSDVTVALKDLFWRAAYVRAGAGWRSPAGRWVVPLEGHVFGAEPIALVAYSDDDGATWTRSTTIASSALFPALAERGDGTLVLTVHRTDATPARETYSSTDEGVTWTLSASSADPVDARSPAALLVVPATDTPTGEEWLVLAGPYAARSPLREDLTLHVSTDGGANWDTARRLHAGPAGTAALARTATGEVAVLYEAGTGIAFEGVSFARVPLEWLAP